MIAALAAAMFGCLPAHAQEDVPELDGGPPPLRIPSQQPAPQPAKPVTVVKPAKPVTAAKPAKPVTVAKPVATTSPSLKAEQDRIARQAAAQKTEQERLAKQSADLKAEKARLDARAAALAAEEQRLAQIRADQDALYTTKMAELARDRAAVPPPLVTPSVPAIDNRGFAPPRDEPRPPVRARYARVSYDDARRACTRAGMAEAEDRDFDSARYQNSPQYDEDVGEFRGLMRMDDRRGFILVDTICELDDEGRVVDFALLR